MIAMVTFVVIFGSISVQSVITLNNKFTVLAEHPFVVSGAVYKIQNYLAQNRIRMSRLVMYNSAEDYAIVVYSIDALNASINAELEIMLERYLGTKETVIEIQNAYNEIIEQEMYFLNSGHLFNREDTNTFIQEKLDPHYNQISDLTKGILKFIDNTVNRLMRESKATVTMVVVSTTLFSIALIAIGIVLKRMVDARRKEREYRDFLFQVLSDHADTVFMIYNLPKDKIEYVFSNSMDILEIHPNKLQTSKMTIFEHCSGEDTTLENALRCNQIAAKMEQEYLFTKPLSNLAVWISLAVHPVETGDVVDRYIISVRDLTEIKNTQQILRDALLNAENANRAKSDFLSRVSHEIRTPMNAIIGMGNIAKSSIDNKERVEDCLKKINISSKHLLMLINDILDLSKIESGKLSAFNECFNITEALRNAITVIYPQTKEKNQTFEVSIPSIPTEMVIGDALRLNQILLNILSNAVKYTPADGNIKLQVKETIENDGKTAIFQIVVSDNGIGMSEDFQKKLFKPFEQEYHQNISRNNSTGIGMAITKNLVQLMSGVIMVKSEPNVGTTFTVELPFEINTESEKKYNKLPEFDALRVLFVDDDLTACENAVLLSKRIGVNLQWTTSPYDAYDFVQAANARNENFHVAFIDWKMPDQDGFELAKRIRSLVGNDMKIIIISSYDTDGLQYRLAESKADEFMPKPISKSIIYNLFLELVEKLKNLADLPSYHDMSPSKGKNTALVGKCILAVDDVEINLEIMELILTDRGIIVDKAVDGEEACEIFAATEEGHYDAILMDVQMPKMNGYDATRTIRKMHRKDAVTIPIIAMTADAFSEDVLMALDSGMNYHISKPIDSDKLFETLEKTML